MNDIGVDAGDWVVKLHGGAQLSPDALGREALASLLARHLGLNAAEGAIVEVTDDVAEGSPLTAGLHFGSCYRTEGFMTWPVHWPVPDTLEQVAAEILAFDALVQNPDRMSDRPNLITNGQEILFFDHELAFSFIGLIGGKIDPWKFEAFSNCLQVGNRRHVFFSHFKGKDMALERFRMALQSLNMQQITAWMNCIPAHWKTGQETEIMNHLLLVASKANEFVNQLKGMMS